VAARDIAGDTAVIHGINTLMQNGKVLDRQRFTDTRPNCRSRTEPPGVFAHSQIQIEFAVYGHPSPAMLLDHGRKR
jgi:hypothetical protein